MDQEHAEEMRKAINNCNTDIAKENPDYVVRVVSDEGQIGRGYLDRFMDVETLVPTVVTTSQMLTTGVDVPTCRNIALSRHQLDDGAGVQFLALYLLWRHVGNRSQSRAGTG